MTMPFALTARLYTALPGAVRLDVIGDANKPGQIIRQDAALEGQPVRNYADSGTGVRSVVDCEAPLGRPVRYSLLDAAGAVLATSDLITVPAPDTGLSLLRSPLRPSVAWMWVEGQDETGVEWDTSSTVHRIVGSDTPVVTSEIRQRRKGTFTFLCKSIADADKLVGMCKDGTIMLLRHSPCANIQVRDMLFYPLSITERRYGRSGWRLLSVEYQASKFIPGDTEEPPLGEWSFGDLRDSAPDFQTITSRYANFASVTLDIRKAGA